MNKLFTQESSFDGVLAAWRDAKAANGEDALVSGDVYRLVEHVVKACSMLQDGQRYGVGMLLAPNYLWRPVVAYYPKVEASVDDVKRVVLERLIQILDG